MNDHVLVLGDVLRAARRFGERDAFRDTTRSVSFNEFERRVYALIDALKRRGLRHGNRIAVLSHNSVSFVECIAAASAGFVLVPLNWRLSPDELRAIVQDCSPAAIFCDGAHRDVAEGGILVGLSVPIRVSLDGAGRHGWLDFEMLINDGVGAQSPQNVPTPPDAALIIYTSGTTGTPKGVVISHGALTYNARESGCYALGVRESDRSLCIMPLFHVGGLCFYLLASYMAGATNVLRPAYHVDELVAAMRDEKITNVHLVPSMIADLVVHPEANAASHALVRILYAGSTMPVELLARAMSTFSRCGFAQAYGSTEGGVIATLSPLAHIDALGDTAKQRLSLSCGRPVPQCAVRIISEDGEPCAIGEWGEVTVSSKGTMTGYWNQPDRSAAAFHEGFLRTGDIGYLDDDGYLFLVDRKNDMIVTGGENVFPSEVEQVLYCYPSVLEAAVFGVPDHRWIERVVAAVVLEEGSSTTAAEISDFVRLRLAGYKCPKQVFILQELPHTGAGKVSRKRLREDVTRLLKGGGLTTA